MTVFKFGLLILLSLLVSSGSTAASAPQANNSDMMSKHVKPQIEGASQKALADPAFTAALAKADADGAKKMLVAYGAPSNVVVAVRRPPTFVFSKHDTGVVEQQIPMVCARWGVIAVMEFSNGDTVTYVDCIGYRVTESTH